MDTIRRDAKDPIRIASRVRQWAVLGSKANIAQFGLQRYLRTERADKTTKEYLKEGQALFLLLQEGEQVTSDGITAAHQLAAVNALEPIKPSGGAHILEGGDITQIVDTINAILEDKNPGKGEVEKSLEKVLNASDAYTDSAFKELDDKEKVYLKPSGVRA
jgi:hypothetical protein